MPVAIRTDNGVPFATTTVGALSRLSIWWIKLGIRPERIEPGKPAQNGRHERMHRTLKRDTTRPAAANILKQQELFDEFQHVYNNERSHEGLGRQTPAEVYRSSKRIFRERLDPVQYPLHDTTRLVSSEGSIKIDDRPYVIARAFGGENVGLRELEDGTWLINFLELELGYLDTRAGRFFGKPS